MLRRYEYRLYPTKSQEILLDKHFGCARYVYNKGLELKIKKYQEEKANLSRFDIQKMLPFWKGNEETKWLGEVSAQSLQNSLKNLDTAFTNFFRKRAKFPNFKKKGNRDSFGLPQGTKVDFEKGLTFILKFREGIKTTFSRRFEGEIKSSTIKKSKSGRYFVSILVDAGKAKPSVLPVTEEKCLGIDLGIKDFATFSDGTKIANPKFLAKKLKKLRRLSRQHSKKKKGSKNREKSRKKLARLHERVADTRKDFQHKLTTQIADNQSYDCVSMETLDIQGMSKNKKLARHIGDASWFQFKTLLKYKLEERGKTLLEIGRFEPSSKMCSCGAINSELKLSDRVWTCKCCGTQHDRDVLAAQNIKRFAFVERCSTLGKGIPEFTPLEIRDCGSTKEESKVYFLN